MNSLTTFTREVRVRLEAATPGPFAYNPATRVVKQDGRDNSKLCTVAKWNDEQEHNDGRLIAHAPTDLAKALAIIEELRGALDWYDMNWGTNETEVKARGYCVSREALTKASAIAEGREK